MRTLLLISLCVCNLAAAFIPPLPALLRDVAEKRKPVPTVEVVFKHRFIKGRDVVEMEERLIKERYRVYCHWKLLNSASSTVAYFEKKSYIFTKDKSITPPSQLFLKYFFPQSYDEWKDALIAEGFLRRDQLLVFKPNFTPQGDPQFWGLKENYLRHEDIFLHRLPQGVSLAIVGFDEGGIRKAVYLDRSLRGVFRLEWKEDPRREGPKNFAWNFDQFSRFAPSEIYPRRLSFEVDGAEVITSELVTWRALSAKQTEEAKKEWRKVAQAVSNSSDLDNSIKLLLSYR